MRGDFASALAEYWADGPTSETPPGHWNVVANEVSDSPGFEQRIGGEGAELDRLEWDVKMYFALNGAVHDAAIAAWGVKGFYDSARPISMIRYMGGLGQSSRSRRPVLRSRRAAAGGRPRRGDHRGSRARRASGTRSSQVTSARSRSAPWRGFPEDPETETSGVGWILAVDWVPYQRSTFVTPAFAGLRLRPQHVQPRRGRGDDRVHRQPVLPGRHGRVDDPAGELIHEEGPTEDVTLQCGDATTTRPTRPASPASTGASTSRVDDFDGRRTGSICGHRRVGAGR